MKILHILGNGFDLNLGLKTGYKDFYDYYISIESSTTSIKDLKSTISKDHNTWSDLELALGKYTIKIKTVDDFDTIFEDIGEQLSKYLIKEEEKFNSSVINEQRFFENLVKPEIFLSTAERKLIEIFKNKFIHNTWVVDIFTFNYTTLVEKIIDKKRNFEIGHHNSKNGLVNLRGIDHIHGFLNDRMILGVNDISQIKNKEFHQNVDVLEALVKEKCNLAYGHTIDNLFKTRINQANIICIFGVSFGDTDNIWWEMIGTRLKEDKFKIIIFTKAEEVSPRTGYKNNRIKRKIRDNFLKKTKLSKDQYELYYDKIYVALNTNMFKDVIKVKPLR